MPRDALRERLPCPEPPAGGDITVWFEVPNQPKALPAGGINAMSQPHFHSSVTLSH